MKLIKNTSGVSLPLAIGLLLLLFIISVTASELVIRALRSARTIEASDKAYYAAEAGIEDALYELSNHAAGYTTPELTHTDVRTADFTENVEWNSQWEIDSFGESTCDGFDAWTGGINPTFCGHLTRGQKVLISFYNDNRGPTSLPDNQIETQDEDIQKIVPTSFQLQLRLPPNLVTDNNLSSLEIDNDRDFNGNPSNSLNEDPAGSTGSCGDDNDCDGLENEDSDKDLVLLWKLIDEDGKTFTPLRGCITDPNSHPSHPTQPNSSICEEDFSSNGTYLSVSFDNNTIGVIDDTNPSTANTYNSISYFLSSTVTSDSKVQLELQIIAPMEAYSTDSNTMIPIPFYEYGIEYDASGNILPDPFFTLRSDGIFRNFKQSIITKVLPETTTRLLDLTVIQQ
jgi:hypothetical protein